AIPEMSGEHALEGIPGTAPRPGNRPKGCFFQPRCTLAVEQCANEFPPVTRVSDVHEVRCFRAADVLAESVRDRRPAGPTEPAGAGGALLTLRNGKAPYGN